MRPLSLSLLLACVFSCADEADTISIAHPKGQLTVTDATGTVVGEQSHAFAALKVVRPATGESCTPSNVLALDSDAYIFSADPLVAGSIHQAYCPRVILPGDPWLGFRYSECLLEVLSLDPGGSEISVALTGPFCPDMFGSPEICSEQRLSVDLVSAEGKTIVVATGGFGTDGVASPDTDLCLPMLDWSW